MSDSLKINIAFILSLVAIVLTLFLFINSSFVQLQRTTSALANTTIKANELERENIQLKQNINIFMGDLKAIKDKSDELKSMLKKYKVE